MMAVVIGADAAMELGQNDKALKFYQSVLKLDPDQKDVRSQYRGLKKVAKLLKEADEQITKGYNKAASVIVDECLSAMRGLDVDSPLFRSKIQLKLCSIQSNMGKIEEALINCDAAIKVRLAIIEKGQLGVSGNAMLKEAYLIRGDAEILDMDYGEAVADFREAFNLVGDPNSEEGRNLNSKWQQAQRQQDDWNGGKKDHYYNEHRGFPDGKPPERDNIKILGLPVNLEEHSTEIQCKWLKNQFKSLVRKWHPDKYKGDSKRAARKFKEVTDAKETLSKKWSCGMKGSK